MDEHLDETTLVDSSGTRVDARVRPRRKLGRGRAATTWLVEVETAARRLEVAEKHFGPDRVARCVYRGAFWSPFPYELNEDAVAACLHRRDVARALLAAEDPDRRWLARALYTRTCRSGHLVLGTEFVRGRPPSPPRPRGEIEGGGDPGEPARLLRHMRRMERVLLRAGLVGSGWQVATSALVTTANFIRDEEGRFVCVDLESGIPAVLAPRYLALSLAGHPLPMFDDLDERKLQRHVEEQRERLAEVLGVSGVEALERSVAGLIRRTRAWKSTEVAPGRHRHRLLVDRDLRARVRRVVVERWSHQERLDARSAAALARSRLLFAHPLVILGALPTRFGRFVHRLAGHRGFRARVQRLAASPRLLDATFRDYQSGVLRRMVAEGRLPGDVAERAGRGLRSTASFSVHAVASVLPVRTQRFLSDWAFASEALNLALFALASERIQERLARDYIDSSVRTWEALGRVSAAGRKELLASADAGDIADYVGGFGTHVALKLFEPVTSGLKIAGAAMFAASPWNPLAIVLLVNTSVFRTLLTAVRWMIRRRHGTAYGVAFLVGMLPAVGTLAFPLQLYHHSPRLSRFLVRDGLSRAARLLPVYGGVSTRVEFALVRLAPALIRILTVLTSPFARRAATAATKPASSATPGRGAKHWRARRVERAIRWWEELRDGAGLDAACFSNAPSSRRCTDAAENQSSL